MLTAADTTPEHRNPLRLPRFRALWLGLILMSTAGQFYGMVVTWLVLELTGSPLQLGGVTAVAAVPRAIMLLVSGAIIDRARPRQLLLVAALGNAVLVAVVGLLLSTQLLTLVVLAGLGALMGLLDAFVYPTSVVLLAHMLPGARLAQGNALMQAADGIIIVAAPALSGWAVDVFGIPTALALNVALFGGGALVVRGIGDITLRAPHEAGATTIAASAQSLWQGFRLALSHPPIRLGLLATTALNFAAVGPVVIGGALLVRTQFNGDSGMYGLFLATFGAGGLAGAVIASFLPAVRRPGRALVWTALALGLSLLLTSVITSFWLVLAVQFASSLVVGATSPMLTAWLQQETPLAMQGRIASLMALASIAIDPLSQAAAGALGEANLTLTFGVPGVLLLLIALALLFSPTTHMAVGLEPS